MKQTQNLRTMSNNQLQNRLNDIEPSLRRIKGLNAAGANPPGSDTMLMRKLRQEKARILTILNEREVGKQ